MTNGTAIAQVDLSNGSAVFNLVSQKLDAMVIEKLVTKLQPLKNHSVDDIHDKLGSDNKLSGLLANKGKRYKDLHSGTLSFGVVMSSTAVLHT